MVSIERQRNPTSKTICRECRSSSSRVRRLSRTAPRLSMNSQCGSTCVNLEGQIPTKLDGLASDPISAKQTRNYDIHSDASANFGQRQLVSLQIPKATFACCRIKRTLLFDANRIFGLLSSLVYVLLISFVFASTFPIYLPLRLNS